jgi:hypothetical protein
MQSVLWALAASTLFVPSGADPGPDRGGMTPLYFTKESTQMLAVFTSADAAASVSATASYLVTFTGLELLGTMPATDGLVVNPGTPVGFDIAPEGLAAFRQELGL